MPLQEEKEKRRLEQLERKKETQRLLEEEDSRLKGGKAPRVAPAKVTRAQIEDSLRREQRAEPGVHVAQGNHPPQGFAQRLVLISCPCHPQWKRLRATWSCHWRRTLTGACRKRAAWRRALWKTPSQCSGGRGCVCVAGP